MRLRNMFPVYKRLGVVAVALALLACGPRPGAIDPANAAQVQRGQGVYQAQCAQCHGANLEGQPEWRVRKPNGRLPAPPHDDSGHTWHHPTDMLVEIIKNGLVPPNAPDGYESDMPAFAGTLSVDDIAATLAFIQSRWGAEVQQFRTQNKLN